MIMMVSPTGARLTKEQHAALPMTLDEIVQATVASAKAGANAVHLHIRDEAGRHSLDVGAYREAVDELARALPEFPVQITTEAAGRYAPKDQCHLLEAFAPKWASISLREVAADPDMAERIYAVCRANGTEIQHIIYDRNDADILRDWQAKDVLGVKESVILVLGSYAAKRAGRPGELEALLGQLPPIQRWMVCAFGPYEHDCLVHAARRGGDVRVGFENSTTNADGVPWPDVASSVAALKQRLDVSA